MTFNKQVQGDCFHLFVFANVNSTNAKEQMGNTANSIKSKIIAY